jgi:hypothetical protein
MRARRATEQDVFLGSQAEGPPVAVVLSRAVLSETFMASFRHRTSRLECFIRLPRRYAPRNDSGRGPGTARDPWSCLR